MFGDVSCTDFAILHNTGYILGVLFNLCLYGVLAMQLYLYYISFPEDLKLFKTVVYIVYAIVTIGTTLITSNLIKIIVGQTSTGVDLYTGCRTNILIAVILGACAEIVAFLTHSMYTYRIRIITKLKCIPWAIFVVITLRLFAVVAISILPRGRYTFYFILTWTSVSVAVDLTITSTMVWFLKKDEIYCKQFKRKITRLVYLILGTGFLTVAVSICSFTLIFVAPGYSVGLSILLPSLYSNSMMVLVNNRIPSTRSENNYGATMDIPSVQLSTFHATTQLVTNSQPEVTSNSSGMRSPRLSVHEAVGDTVENAGQTLRTA